MENTQLENLLASYNHQLEESKLLNLQSWVLNFKCYEALQTQKTKSKLRSLILIKSVVMLLGIIWVLFLGFLLYHSLEMSKIFFVISVVAVMLITSAAVIVYAYHLVLILKINNSDSVIKNQETIARLQLSTINISRILFLQGPFYCTFWWSTQMIVDSPVAFWLISVPIALLFTFASIWLYMNISYRNADKKWFRILFNSPEWNVLTKASAMLKEIDEYKKGN